MPIENEIVRNLIQIIEEGISHLKEQQKMTYEEYARDWRAQDVVEREFQKTIQACIDIGARLIALRSFRRADDYHEIFVILSQEGVIPYNFVEQMKEMVGFRNVLVHEYRRIRTEEVYRHLQESLSIFEKFTNHVVTFWEG